MRATVTTTITEPATTLELEEVSELYNFQLVVVIAGAYLVPVLIGLLGCFWSAQ
jgi:hypothetical protein